MAVLASHYPDLGDNRDSKCEVQQPIWIAHRDNRNDGGGPIVVGLLVLGGVLYNIGAILYGLRWPNPWPHTFGYHEFFHAFTAAAAVSHYVAVWFVVQSLASRTATSPSTPATFRFSGGLEHKRISFLLVIALQNGRIGPLRAPVPRVWPDLGRMDSCAEQRSGGTQVTTDSTYTDAHGVGLPLSQFAPPSSEHRIRQG